MFGRLVWESFARQRRRKLLAGLAILLGTTAVTAMLALATTIGDRIHRELAVYGANLVITPKADTLEVKLGDQVLKPATGGAVLHESDLAKLRTIFWANNITGVSPELHQFGMMLPTDSAQRSPDRPSAVWHWKDPRMPNSNARPVTAVGYWFHHPFGSMITGASELHPSWRVEGRWPSEAEIKSPRHGEAGLEIVLGASLARQFGLRVGDWISMGNQLEADVVGIASTGDTADQQIFFPLVAMTPMRTIWPGAGPALPLERDVDRVEVSARTKPEDAFARKDPDSLSPRQRDVWYCRPYANSIAYQIHEAIPGAQAEPVRQVEQSEGTILERISGLLWLVSAAALIAAAVAVSAAMATAVLERRAEVGLMRSLGASRGRIASLFYAEAGLLAVLGGLLGYALGSVLAAALSARIFGNNLDNATNQAAQTVPMFAHAFNPVLLPIVLLLALLVAIAGSTASIRAALRLSPTSVLRADA